MVKAKVVKAMINDAFTDKDDAQANRERLQQPHPEQDQFYLEQAHITNQWQWGQPPPKGLVLGDISVHLSLPKKGEHNATDWS